MDGEMEEVHVHVKNKDNTDITSFIHFVQSHSSCSL